jgi:hypothetical protein
MQRAGIFLNKFSNEKTKTNIHSFKDPDEPKENMKFYELF